MNTLSAKADSFFEHPAYWRGYAQLARSRPGTLKNIPSGVNVPIEHQSASASVNTNGQGLRHVLTARRAELTRVVRGHLNYFTTSLRNFVSEYFDEARPCDVGNRSGKSVVLDHPLDVQAFDSNLAVAGNQIIGNFVLVLAPKIGHASMNSGDTAFRFLPVASAFLLPGDRTLRTSKLRQFSLEKARVRDLFSVRERGEVSQPDVESDRRKDVPNWSGFTNITSHYQKPLIRFSLQGKRLDLSLHFTVKTDADRSDMLHAEPVAFEPNAVSVTRKEYRVESVGAFESRVTGFLAGFDAAKEIGERFIQACAA